MEASGLHSTSYTGEEETGEGKGRRKGRRNIPAKEVEGREGRVQKDGRGGNYEKYCITL